MTTESAINPDARYLLARYDDGTLIAKLSDLDQITIMGILEITCGGQPEEMLQDGGEIGSEWKYHIGGPHWVIAVRTD